MNTSTIRWVLRIAVFGEFLGHAVFALQKKAQWVGWTEKFLSVSAETAGTIIFWVGILDLIVAVWILLRPMPAVLLWAVFWGFWTALFRPLVGEPIWDFIERWANWGAPLALYMLLPKPKLQELRSR